MKFLTLLVTAGTVLQLAWANCHGQTVFKRFEELDATPRGWTQLGRADPFELLDLRIAMTQPDPHALYDVVDQVSTPDHPRYGQHLGKEELKQLLKPSDAHLAAVTEWLARAGVRLSDINQDGEWINLRTTVATAESLLNTDFGLYQHESGEQRIRALSYSVPQHVADAVSMIHPVTHFGRSFSRPKQSGNALRMNTAKRQEPDFSDCSVWNTPVCLRQLYNFPPLDASKNNSNFLGINSFLHDYAQYESLANFEAQFAPWANGTNFTWSSIDGGKELQGPSESGSGEADLDVQYGIALAWPYAVHVLSDGALSIGGIPDAFNNSTMNEDWIGYLTYMLNLPDDQLPATLSTSYAEDEQNFAKSYTTQACKMFAQLGARGVSFITGSGDWGVNSICEQNFGNNATRFLPSWPSSCPYVTSVGGTMDKGPEIAWDGSSGGFSERFPRPKWQEKAVSGYLEYLGDRWAGLYNKTGRGIPDIAAQAVNFPTRDSDDDGVPNAQSGTSASTPVVAAIIAHLNGARIRAGQAPLGFLNPWLYSKGVNGLTDITEGANGGCFAGPVEHQVPGAGFNATVGWDPVTGLGTPNLRKLLKIALKRN